MTPLLLLSLSAGLTRAAPAPADPVLRRISPELRRLPGGEVVKVLLEVPRGDEAAVAVAAEDLGPHVVVEVATRGRVQLWAPALALEALAELDGVQRLRRPHRARTKGEVSEGVEVIGVEDWHDEGLTGVGVDVAVLDTEFAGYEDLLGEELPKSVYTSFQGDWWDYDAHGTAVAEIIHDIAPDAAMSFYQFEDEGQFLDAVDEMIDNGEYLVSASIGFDNTWHADGSSVYCEAVEDFVDSTDGLWINAAGNEAESYWVGTLTDDDGDGWLEFDGTENMWVYGWDDFGASLRWEEPFGTASTDIDLYASEDEGGDACGTGENYQEGDGDPYEEAWCEGEGGWVSAYDHTGTAVGMKAWLYAWNGIDEDYAVVWETLTMPGDCDAAFTVGAVEHSDLSLATYSSRGPTNDGRTKPDLVAPTTVSTESWGSEGFPGTSSATPHVSGVAALLYSADRDADAGDVQEYLEDNAEDMGEAGFDNEYGHGLLTADDIPEGKRRRACGCAGTGAAGGPFVLALVALLGRRRRG